MTTAAQRRPTRAQLLNQPRSGARSLSGSGAAPATAPAAAATSRAPARSPRPAAPPASSTVSNTAVAQRQAAAQQQPAQQAPARQAAPVVNVSTGGVAHQAGGAVLALFLWPLLMNLVKGGTGQMWGWVKAKFINEPYSPGASGKAAPSQAVQTNGAQPLTQAQINELLKAGVNPQTIEHARAAS